MCDDDGVDRVDCFASQLEAAGYRGRFETDASASIVYGTDNSIYQLSPVAVAVPVDADDLAVIARVNDGLDDPFALVARGGGTGTNGQSLADGVVVDTRRSMNDIVSIDVDARTAVVQPGVVLGELNAVLQPHDLFFAPHVSTASRATIGGMVATDAAGKGSLVHGRTNGHVVALDMVLADGSRSRFESGGSPQPAQRSAREAAVYSAVSNALHELPGDAFPDVPRGFTGYNLAGATSIEAGPDLTKLICGSEGTLGFVAEITIRLTPIVADPHLVVASFGSFDDAIRASNQLTSSSPIAIECLDDRTISLAVGSTAFPGLAELMDDDLGGCSLLLMEFDGANGVSAVEQFLDREAVSWATTSDASVVADIWKVRSDAVGLLGRAVDGRRSIAFVEDCAVPPARLAEFVREFRAVLDRHQVGYGMFGHADVGCVHVRPALDLYDLRHEALVRTISNEVADLVDRYGGVLWGEHGRGFRGEFVRLDDETIDRMRRIKTAFDPKNVLNPGKLYAPDGVETPIARIDEVPLRIHRDRTVAEAQRTRFETAFGCNGNGICHHWGAAEVMCPSYKVTLDPRLSPKGRADMLRAWLADPNDRRLAAETADSLRQCLSCGACTGRCPVGVDIPEMKSRFLDRYSEPFDAASLRRRLRTTVLSRFESMLPSVQSAASVVAPLRRLLDPIVDRALGVADLPAVPGGSLSSRLDRLGVAQVSSDGDIGDATIVILPDAFTAFIEPDVLTSAIGVLRAMGERPAVGPFAASGKLDHVHGRRRRFARAVARRRHVIESFAPSTVLVEIEPAIALMHRHECTSIDRSFPDDRVASLATVVAARLDRLPAPARQAGQAGQAGQAQFFGHCAEVSLAPENSDAYRAILTAAGYDVTSESTTCCGMAGIFGHEAEHLQMSNELFETGWRSRLRAPFDVRCASGSSCRSQAARLADADLVHPVQVLARTIGA